MPQAGATCRNQPGRSCGLHRQTRIVRLSSITGVGHGAGDPRSWAYERPARCPAPGRSRCAERSARAEASDSRGMHVKGPYSGAVVRPYHKECRKSTTARPVERNFNQDRRSWTGNKKEFPKFRDRSCGLPLLLPIHKNWHSRPKKSWRSANAAPTSQPPCVRCARMTARPAHAAPPLRCACSARRAP